MARFVVDGFEMRRVDELREARLILMQEALEAENAAAEAEQRRQSDSLPVRMQQRDADLKSGYVAARPDDPFDKTPLGKFLAGEEVRQ